MSKKSVFWFFIIFSIALHLIVGLFFSISIEGPQLPSIFCWSNIVKKNDLQGGFSKVDLPKGIPLDNFDLQRKYFSSGFVPMSNVAFISDDKEIYPKTKVIVLEPGGDTYIYLWEKPPIFSILTQEQVPYKIYVSDQGKILVSYPQQLTYHTTDGLILQQYLRESALFARDKFFWTKVKGVIK